DRKKSGALIVILGRRDRIAKQPADVRMTLLDQGRRPRRDEAVYFAGFQQARNRRAVRGVVEPHARRQLDRKLFGPTGVLDAAADPVDVRGLDAVVVFQERARPYIGGELVFRQPDLATLEVFGLFHAVGADIDRGVAKGARDESRHGNVWTIVLRGFDGVARQRQFADVEFGGAKGA